MDTSGRSGAVAPYCPYDLVEEPTELGLHDEVVENRFGRQHVVRSPRTSDTCTLLVHGVGATWTQWTPLLCDAASIGVDLGDTVLVDLPGFGGSENLLGHLEIEQVGDELLGVVRGLGYTRVRLLGHSMGGFLCLDMASRRHEEIVSLDVVAGAYFSIVRTVQEPVESVGRRPFVAASYGMLAVMASIGPPVAWAARTLGRSALGEPFLYPFVVHPRRIGPRLRASLASDLRPESFLLAARNGHGYDPVARWSSIDVPVRGVFGRSDRLVPPEDMAELGRCLPSARLTLVDEAAHLVHIEQPRRTLWAFGGGTGA